MFIPTAAAGNGSTLVTFGRAGEVMGFFYPRIDYAKNVREAMPAVRLLGAPEPGRFLWLFEPVWEVHQEFAPRSNELITRLRHGRADLAIEIRDLVPVGEHALLRKVSITRGPEVGPVQFMHYFHLAVEDEDTRNGVVVYADRNLAVQHCRNVAIAVSANRPLRLCCGGRHGHDSTVKRWMEAGDFPVSRNAIGRVDFGVAFEPVNGSQWEGMLVIAAGRDSREAAATVERLAVDGAYATALRSSNQRIASRLAGAGECPVSELKSGFERAVISLNDLYDENQGTFIAAPAFDPGYELSGGYGYCWPRDAAVCALVSQRIGRSDAARRFFEWSTRTQLPDGHWYQRYWLDGAEAPSWCIHADRIQLDQTCAILHAAGQFARSPEGGESFVRSYRQTADNATRAILDYIGPDGLHKTASDLWEHTTGSFPYTQAAVIAALREADEVFGLDRERTGAKARSRLRDQLVATFWQRDRHRWINRITSEGHADATQDSSAMGLIYPWEVLDLNDTYDRRLAVETLEGISHDLRSEVKRGKAILRFEGEAYMGGGPGCVNTLWLALCRLKLSATAVDEREREHHHALAMEDLRIALANTSPTGQLPELIPKIRFDYWAAPHAWACALLIEAVLQLREAPKGAVELQQAGQA